MLTTTACNNAKPKDKPYKLADSGGLFLWVHNKGGKLWRLKYRFLRVEKLLSIGAFPDVSLAEAREAREKAKKLLQQGIDPSAAKKEKVNNAVAAAEQTFEAIGREW